MRSQELRIWYRGREKTPGHQGCDACRWPFSLPWRRTEIPAHPVFTAALGRSSRPTLSISGAWRVRKIELVGGRSILVHVTATSHLIEFGGLHIRDFYYPGPLCLRSATRHFAALRQSAAAIDQT